MNIGAKLAVVLCVPSQPRVDREPEQEDADRAADDFDRPAREHAAEPAGQRPPARLLRAAARGHRTASATNETTSTIAAAHPNSHSGMGRSDAYRDPVRDQEHGLVRRGSTTRRADERVAPRVLGHVALDLELALEVRPEPEAGRLPGAAFFSMS